MKKYLLCALYHPLPRDPCYHDSDCDECDYIGCSEPEKKEFIIYQPINNIFELDNVLSELNISRDNLAGIYLFSVDDNCFINSSGNVSGKISAKYAGYWKV